MKKLLFYLIIIVVLWFGYKAAFRRDAQVLEQEPSLSGEAQSDSTALEAVEGYSGSGTATRIWNGTTFAHVVFTDLRPPATGKFYEGWLVRPKPFEIISTGKLIPTESGYGLRFTMDRNFIPFNDVVITEETEANGLDGVPETHVLEGSF